MSEQASKKSNKRLSVERIYQKKSQLEHIILRPDSYIGSDQPIAQNMWVWDSEKEAIVSKSITYTPGLYKIFDEIIGKYIFITISIFKVEIQSCTLPFMVVVYELASVHKNLLGYIYSCNSCKC